MRCTPQRSPWFTTFLLGMASAGGCLTGCGVDDESMESIQAMMEQASHSSSASFGSGNQGESMLGGGNALSAALGTLTHRSSSGKTGAEASGATDANYNAKYDAPYPDRHDPFRFPDDPGEGSSANPSTSVADIQVLGFANVVGDSGVAQQRVLLKTSDDIVSVSAGDRIGGMSVLRIDEPAVELQMGALIWTATMFDR